MWAPWMAANFGGMRRSDIVNENIRLQEIVAMWDALKAADG